MITAYVIQPCHQEIRRGDSRSKYINEMYFHSCLHFYLPNNLESQQQQQQKVFLKKKKTKTNFPNFWD